jgi:hypothetical protein
LARSARRRRSGSVAQHRLGAGEASVPDEVHTQLEELGEVTGLRAFRDLPREGRQFGTGQMLSVARQAQELLSGFYVHLPLKRTVHAANPEQRLRVLCAQLEDILEGEQNPLTEDQFHYELSAIFTSLRDRHTGYVLPYPYRTAVAFLPFVIEECVDDESGRRFIVSKTCGAFPEDPDFAAPNDPERDPIVEVTHWNGTRIERAVDLNADSNAGSNRAARWARGLDRLTFRWMGASPPPTEDWVVITYSVDGTERNLRFPWLVVRNPDLDEPAIKPGRSFSLGLDPEGEWIRKVKQALYGSRHAYARKTDPYARNWRGRLAYREERSDEPDRRYGYLRIYSFDVDGDDHESFVSEVVDILKQGAPPDGLIIDIRGNPGGHMVAAERLLQLFSPSPVEQEPLQFINTPSSAQLARKLYQGRRRLLFQPRQDEALATASLYISSLPLDEAEIYNSLGQRYQGPVVLIVDALAYSASDVFAAGFEDHGLGTIIGVGSQTGAGGGNVWGYETVKEVWNSEGGDFFQDLPEGASFTIAVRRMTRVRDRAGLALEDLGVVVEEHRRHCLTTADLLQDNKDLRAKAVAQLEENEGRRYQLNARYDDGREGFAIDARNVDRVDVFLDERPHGSMDWPPKEPFLEVKRPKNAHFVAYLKSDPRRPVASYPWPQED